MASHVAIDRELPKPSWAAEQFLEHRSPQTVGDGGGQLVLSCRNIVQDYILSAVKFIAVCQLAKSADYF